MSDEQVKALAEDVADMAEEIESFFADPANQKEFEVWLNERTLEVGA